MSALVKTIWSLFDPVLNFFQSVWDFISGIFSFIFDLIEWLYYSFNTIITYLYNSFLDITWLSFFTDNSDSIHNIVYLLWSSSSLIFFSLFYVCLSLVVIRFIFSLIPIFKSWRK